MWILIDRKWFDITSLIFSTKSLVSAVMIQKLCLNFYFHVSLVSIDTCLNIYFHVTSESIQKLVNFQKLALIFTSMLHACAETWLNFHVKSWYRNLPELLLPSYKTVQKLMNFQLLQVGTETFLNFHFPCYKLVLKL